MKAVTVDRIGELESLMRRHQADVWRYLRLLGCDHALADDLTQDVFIAALGRGLSGMEQGQALAYLRVAARNMYLNTVRKAAHTTALTELNDAEAAWAQSTPDDGADERLSALEDCLETLDERARLAIELRYKMDAAGPDIARRLETSEDGVYSLLKRTRAALRQCIERKVRP